METVTPTHPQNPTAAPYTLNSTPPPAPQAPQSETSGNEQITALLVQLIEGQEQLRADLLEQMQLNEAQREKTYKPVRQLAGCLNIIIAIQFALGVLYVITMLGRH